MIGQNLSGVAISHYKIIEKLGGGGMGVVYKAEDSKLKRLVALKFLPLNLTRDDEARQRFINEAQAASALDHPNICTIHEIDETADGQMFIAMAYYEGETLRKKIGSAPLSVNCVVDIAIQIAQGLSKAHEKGIIHRDLKPGNIFLIPNDRDLVKILDFGLAKLAGVTRLTKAGKTMGTLPYMSPEQAQGMDADNRSDIWSFGVLLYEMITGQLPFKGEYEQVMMYSILNEDPEPIIRLRPGTPMTLECAVDKAMAKRPEERYQRMEEMLVDLKSIAKAVEQEIPESGRTKAASRRGKRNYLYTGIAGLLILLLGLSFAIRQFRENRKATISSGQYRIAVLPLTNISPEGKDEYFADGMTEELISTLSKVSRFRVIARTSVMAYKDSRKDIAAIGRELKVGTILEGSVRRADNNLRITAQLIDVRRQEPIWTEDYDRKLQEVFAIQSDIAQRVAAALQAELPAGDKRRIEKRPTENLEAYTSYLKGRFFWNKRTTESLKRGMAYFEQAIAQDSAYALAYAGLADSYALLGTVEYGGLAAKEAIPKAKAAAKKALALDEQCAEAHASLANIRYTYEWDWRGAEQEFKRAFVLNPNYTMARHWYAHYLAARGRFDEAIAEIRLAQELDPLSLIINTTVGMVFYFNRQPDQAIEQLRQVLEIDPNFIPAQLQLGVFFVQQQRFDEAIAAFQKAINLIGENPITLALLGHAYASSGKRDEALAILAKLQQPPLQPFVSPSYLALVYLGLGEKERTFEWLQKAYEERANYLIYLKVDPLFDDLRSDPRFAALLNKMGLEK